MYKFELNSTTKKSINDNLLRTLGISLKELDELSFDDQQRIIREYRKKHLNNKYTKVMVGTGEHSTFIPVKKGEKVIIGAGRHSCFMEAGLSLEESQKRLDDKIDDMIYCKPVTLVKNIFRRIKR